MATLAIGDIHGNLAALTGLLAIVEAEVGRGDTVVFLGDNVDRGPDSRGCIQAILEWRSRITARVVCLRGNHEDWLLRTREDFTHHSWLLGMDALVTVSSYSADAASNLRQAARKAGLRLYTERVPLPYDAFFDAILASHVQFLSELQDYVLTEDCFCSHAGLNPHLPLTEQTARSLVWGESAFPEAYREDTLVVYGHWNDGMPDEGNWPRANMRTNTIGIDTIVHGVLTAVRLPGRTIFQSRRHRR